MWLAPSFGGVFLWTLQMASRSLGTLTLDLIAKTGNFEAGMTKAERASARSSKKIAKDAEEASKRAQAAFKAIGIAAVGALGGLSAAGTFSAVIDNTKQMEQEQAQLAAVLKSTGEAAGYSRDQLNSMASALSGKSVFSAGEINQAQTALLAFTGVMGGEFVRAQQAAADMAARTGMSIQAATETIGRALDVPSAGMAALSRQGFRFSEDQKKLMVQLESTGKTAEAQGIILDALEESYGGAAQAARDTFGGALDALRNTLDDLMTGEEGGLEGARLAIEKLNTELSSPEAAAAFSSVVSSIAAGASVMVKALAAIPWDHVVDGVKVVSAVLATRFVVATGASAVSMAAATVEAIKYQRALASMAGVSTRAAVGITTVSVAARAASAAMALLGGPVGAAILAAGALTYFATRSSDAQKEADALDARIRGLDESFKSLTVNQAAAAIRDYSDKLVSAEKTVEDLEEHVSLLNKEIERHPNAPDYKEWQNALIDAKRDLDTASQAVDDLRGKIEQLNDVMSGPQPTVQSAVAASEAYTKLAASLDEQILLLGKKTDAEKLQARIAAGLVEGLVEGEGEKLIAKQKVIDAAKVEEAAEKERESKAKSAAKAAESAAKAAIERAQSEAKAVQESVNALVLQEKQLGWTASAVKLYELESRGATEAQLTLAAAALEATEAFAAQEKVNAEAKGVIDALMSEEEAILASYERRKQVILDTTLATAEEKAELLRRLEEETDEALLEINGSYWERYLAAAEENLTSFDELAGDVLENFSSRFGNAFEAMVFDAQNLGDAARSMAEGMARSVVNALGQMAAQWLAYQAVQLLVGKTTQATGAAALVSTATATSLQAGLAAYASTAAIPVVGPAAAPMAMSAALVATAPLVAGISMASMAGMAHDGIDSVPQTGTWLLEKGERVVTSETSAKLDATLSRIEAGQGARRSGGLTVNIIEDRSRAGEVEQSMDADGNEEANAFVADVFGDGKRSRALQQVFGLVRVGR